MATETNNFAMADDNSLDVLIDDFRSSTVESTAIILDQCYPGWFDGQEGRSPIMIPVCFDQMKSYVGPLSPTADGYRKKLAEGKHLQKLILGDDAELIFYSRMLSLDIGGIVIASVQWQQLRKQLQLADLNFGDSETDFIILHPQLGIYAVEVKASPKITARNNGKKREAEKQLSLFSENIFEIYKRLTGTVLDERFFGGAGFFAPHSNFQGNQSQTTTTVHQQQPQQPQMIDHICPNMGGDSEEFMNFWKEKILSSVAQYGKRNIFVQPDFRTFLLKIVGYRGETFISGPKLSAELAKRLKPQVFVPLSKIKYTGVQNKSVVRRFKWHEDEGCGQDIFLTDEQCRVTDCSEKLQLIFGAPGTGKTTILLLKALMAAKEDKPGRVVIETWEEFEPRVRRFMDSYAFDLKRQIVFGFDDSPKEDDDVFRDEMGPNGLQFLLWRAEKRQTGQTVAVFTGSINGGEYKQELAHIWSTLSARAERTYMEHTLTTIMRNTKNIASYWMKESGINHPVGHNLDGEPVVHKEFLLVSQVLEQVAETLRNLLFVHKVLRRSIAIIGPRRQEVKKMLKYLKPLFPGNEEDSDRLNFRSATKFAEGENAVTVDVYSSVLSQEWDVVIAFSLTCADFKENFRFTAFSRAISRLFYFERNYSDIQNSIAQVFDSQVKNMLEYPAINKLVNNGIKLIGFDLKESDSSAISVHQILTALRENYIAGTGVFIFNDCDTFSKCLQHIMLDDNRLRLFVFRMSSTELVIRDIKYRMQWSHNRKPKLFVLKRQKFFERALQIDKNSSLGKIYLEFCNLRCKVVLDFYNERANETYQRPAPFEAENNRDCERVVNAADMLVKSQCSLRFEPI